VTILTKKRVYEVAKEFGMTSKKLMANMKDLDLEIKSHMSTLEDDEVNLLKEILFENTKDKDEEVMNIETNNDIKKDTVENINENINEIEFEENIVVSDLAEKLDIDGT